MPGGLAIAACAVTNKPFIAGTAKASYLVALLYWVSAKPHLIVSLSKGLHDLCKGLQFIYNHVLEWLLASINRLDIYSISQFQCLGHTRVRHRPQYPVLYQ